MTDNITWAPDGSLVTGQQPDPELLCEDCGVNVAEEDHAPECSVVTLTEDEWPGPHLLDDGTECQIAEPHTHIEEEEDYSDILTDEEIRSKGAMRKDDAGARYWLDLPQLAEFTRMDEKMSTDEEFWGWFKSFKEANSLKPVQAAPAQKQKRGLVQPQWNDYWSEKKSTPKKYLSDWWGGSGYYHYGGYSDKTKKLAIALQAVQSTVRVIDNNVKRMRVRFTQETDSAPNSYTAYNERLISVSPKAILDEKLSEGDGIDITTGFALHEASHVEYSEASMVALKMPTEMAPLAIAGLLHNLFEDIRIEQLTSKEFPGFAGYFEKGLEYMWPFVEEHAPKEWGPDLEAKVNAIIAGVKWPIQYQLHAEDGDANLATEMQWWRDLSGTYAGGMASMREVLEQAMARLREDEQTQQELDDMAKEEKDAQARGEMAMPLVNMPQAVQDAVKKLMDEGKMTIIEVCPSPNHGAQAKEAAEKRGPKDELTAAEGLLVSTLASSELEVESVKELKIPELGNTAPEILTLHPEETMESKAMWTPPLRGLVGRMRNAFFFRPVAQQWTTRLMRSGSLDEDQVWSASPILGKDRDYRVFEQKNVESSPDTTITLLVDISGSMAGEKMRYAMQAAAIMHEVLKSTPGVKVRMRAHTGDITPGDDHQAIVYKVWESGEPISRLGIPETVPHGNNYDGYAIGWCVREMLRNARPSEQRLLIVLSDGYPHGRRYGGIEAENHVKMTQTWAQKQGVDVVQIAIDSSMDPARQARMFDHWVPFSTLEALPGQITAILKKAIK